MEVTGYARRQPEDIISSTTTTTTNPTNIVDVDPSQRRFNNNGTVRSYSTAPQMFNSNNLQTNNPCILNEHKAAVSRLRAPAKTNFLVSASVDGTIRIWACKFPYFPTTFNTFPFPITTITTFFSMKPIVFRAERC